MILWYLPAVFFSSLFIVSFIGAVILGVWVAFKLRHHMRLSVYGTALLLFTVLPIFFYVIMRTLIALSTIAFVIVIALVIAAMIHMASRSLHQKSKD